MLWCLANWRTITITAIIVVLCSFSFKLGKEWVQSDWDKEKAVLVKYALDNGKVVHDLGVKHDNDQIAIDKLHADNHALWLRLPKTACVRLDTTESSGEAATTGELLPGDPQQAINGYTEGVRELMYKADSVVNDCRVVMEWAKSLEKK